MWPNPQETVDLVIFTEEISMKSFIFCAVNVASYKRQLKRKFPLTFPFVYGNFTWNTVNKNIE